jgi:hypothetical protein
LIGFIVDLQCSSQGTQVSGDGANVRVVQFRSERRHLAFDPRRDDLVNARVAPAEIVKVRAFIAPRVITVAMRAVQQKEMTSYSDIGS